MARVLGINAVFHDPAAAVVVDRVVVGALALSPFLVRRSSLTTKAAA